MRLQRSNMSEPTPTSTALPPALDLSVLEALRSLGGNEIVADLTAAFAADGQDRLRKMHESLNSGDDTGARLAAHSLKGMSGSIGAMHLAALSGSLEKADPGAINHARVQEIEQEFRRVSEALQAA